MKRSLIRFRSNILRFCSSQAVVAAAMALVSCGSLAQQPLSIKINAQREAMQRLSFLTGRWSGPASIVRGPGDQLHLVQTEDVRYKLGGLVLVIEGESTSSDGKVQFQALATISFDDASSQYRIRAYNNGRFLDAELTVVGEGFSWGFTEGPARIVNTMHLTRKGKWLESTEVTFGDAPPRRSVDMLLEHRK